MRTADRDRKGVVVCCGGSWGCDLLLEAGRGMDCCGGMKGCDLVWEAGRGVDC